jgi:hypothetical protein
MLHFRLLPSQVADLPFSDIVAADAYFHKLSEKAAQNG